MPNRIDRSAFPGQSGAGQQQILMAFRFFHLIDEGSKPTEGLHLIAVKDEKARKAALKKMIEGRYSDLFALNLLKTTPAELGEQMTKSYNVTGDTRVKATRFFLAAAEYLGIDVSPLLMKSSGNGSSAPRRRRGPARTRTPEVEDDPVERAPLPPATEVGESHSIKLKGGGTLTLSASAKFFSLEPTERNFVFLLLDKLRDHEQGSAPVIDLPFDDPQKA
jgi:hypothetical protein